MFVSMVLDAPIGSEVKREATSDDLYQVRSDTVFLAVTRPKLEPVTNIEGEWLEDRGRIKPDPRHALKERIPALRPENRFPTLRRRRGGVRA